MTDIGVVRKSLALGALFYGYIDIDEAAELAGVGVEELRRDLQESAGRPDQAPSRPLLSVVIPVLNEEDNVDPLVQQLVATIEPLGFFELIFVDDGSTDTTHERLAKLRERDIRVKVIRLSRNFGHQSALSAGLARSTGEAVVFMDADGQDPPELLLDFVEKWRDGYEVVFGVRRRRKEAFWRRAAYHVFYRMMAKLADLNIPIDAGDFCLMDRRAADALRALPETSQYLRGLRSWVGFKQTGIEYDRPARFRGETKYPFRKLVRLALDGLLSFSTLPLRIASLLGFLTSLAGLGYLLFGVAVRLLSGEAPPGWTSIIAVIVLLGGAQLTVIGVLGEYLSRVYGETKRRPRYVIRDTLW